jgi:hypothetical protein
MPSVNILREKAFIEAHTLEGFSPSWWGGHGNQEAEKDTRDQV